MTPGPGIEPGTHWWKAGALTTASSLLSDWMYQLAKTFSENFSSFCLIIEDNIEEGGKPENPEKNPRSKDENQQQTQPTYDAGSGN